MIRAYNQLGYAGTAIGNHEFDFGPVGPAVLAKAEEDPRGALKARAAEATFPFLVTNIVDTQTGATGSVTAPQRHFEFRKGSAPVDPMKFLPGA